MSQIDYNKQAEDFLTRNGIKFRATLSDSKCPPWIESGSQFGHHYRVTLSKRAYEGAESLRQEGKPKRLVFDFWGSIADAEKGITDVSAYDVLACISGDAYAPESFEDFCAEYGYDTDSIQALQTFRRVDRFAKRLRAFFTESELEQLAEIR